MATPNLNIPAVSASQNQKEVTINAADLMLEQAITETLALDFSSSTDHAITVVEAQRCRVIVCSGVDTVGRELSMPLVKKETVIDNTANDRDLSVSRGTTTITVTAGSATTVYQDGTANGLIVTGGGSGGSTGSSAQPEYRIIIVAGQSNMVGVDEALGVGNTFEPDVLQDWTSDRIMQFSPDGNNNAALAERLLLARDPLLFPFDLTSAERNAEYAASPAMDFARSLLVDAPSNVRFVLIPAALRGTGFTGTDTWLSPSGTLYVAARDAALAALAALPNATVTHMIWIQGEDDASVGGTAISNYESRLLAMIAAMRTAVGNPEMLFISGGMVPEYRDNVGAVNPTETADYIAVDAIHKAYPMSIDYAYHVPGPLGYATSGNEIHYDPDGCRLIGRLMESVEHLVLGLTDAAPSAATIAYESATEIEITVPSTGAHRYNIQTKAQGSADPWTDNIHYLDAYLAPGETVVVTVPGADVNLFDVQVVAQARGGDATASATVQVGTFVQTPQPTFSNVKLLVEFDGTDAATSAVDLSSVAATLTFNGNAQLDTAQSRFAPSALLLDGTGDYVSAPDNTNYEFGSGDFCIELHARWDNVPTNSAAGQGLISKYLSTGNQRSWALMWGQGSLSELQLFISTDGTTPVKRISYAWTPAADTWYHIAVTKASNVYKLWIDGVQVASVTQSETLFGGTALLNIGAYGTNYMGMTGGPAWLDGVRIVKGESVYTTDFPKPQSPHDPGARSYWRLNITDNNGSASFISIDDIEMRASVGGADQCTGGTAIESGHDGSFVPAGAFDGVQADASNFWKCNGATGWVGYQFASPVIVREVVVTSRGDGDAAASDEAPMDFSVEWSDDGSTWRKAWDVTGSTGWSDGGATRTFSKP